MLARLLSAVVGGVAGKGNTERQPVVLPAEAPSAPLHPPGAQNDDGMRRACEAVEEALRNAGHLPRDTESGA